MKRTSNICSKTSLLPNKKNENPSKNGSWHILRLSMMGISDTGIDRSGEKKKNSSNPFSSHVVCVCTHTWQEGAWQWRERVRAKKFSWHRLCLLSQQSPEKEKYAVLKNSCNKSSSFELLDKDNLWGELLEFWNGRLFFETWGTDKQMGNSWSWKNFHEKIQKEMRPGSYFMIQNFS